MSKTKKVEVVEQPTVEQPKVKKITIASQIIEMIMEGKLTNEQIKNKILESNSKAKTTYACVAWYRTKLRKEGKIGERVYVTKAKVEEPKAE